MLPASYAWIAKETAPEWTMRMVDHYGEFISPGVDIDLLAKMEQETGATLKPYFAWCGEFQALVMKESGIEPPSGYLGAANWAGFGNPALDGPQFGDILVFHWNGGSDAGGFHVTEYVGEDTEGFLHCFGGNQGHRVRIDRFPRSELYACRRPIGYAGCGTRLLKSDGSHRE